MNAERYPVLVRRAEIAVVKDASKADVPHVLFELLSDSPQVAETGFATDDLELSDGASVSRGTPLVCIHVPALLALLKSRYGLQIGAPSDESPAKPGEPAVLWERLISALEQIGSRDASPPQVNFHQGAFTHHVNVAAPNVTVEPPDVKVAPEIHMPAERRPVSVRVKRDVNGHSTYTPVYDKEAK